MRRRAQRRRKVTIVSAVGLGALLVMWVLANQTAWAGPIFASSLRRMLGDDRVASIEDTAYGAQDAFNRWRRVQEALLGTNGGVVPVHHEDARDKPPSK